MYEDAQEILEYLPIRRNTPEDDYINHLWQAFNALDAGEDIARPFALMPFHLLFMLVVQYKILRISKVFTKECNLVFCTSGGRSKDQLNNPDKSVFDLALLNERSLPELFRLVDLKDEQIKILKEIVDYRNDNLAHPKGAIEPDPEGRISQYLDILKNVQDCMIPLNDTVAKKWMSEMDWGESGVEYIEMHLVEEYLCPADMQSGMLAKLYEKLNEKFTS